MMKKILIAAAFLFVITGLWAQNFEGVISWTIKTDIKDPKMKAQMEEAQKRMNDPATQAQMKEMQARMQDPQFKAMMESNPQMKAQMEKMMNMANSGNMNDMMPKGMTVKVKNRNTLTKMDGGMLAGEILYLNEKDVTYHIDRENKTYSVMGKGDDSDREMKGKVTATSESAKIQGYNCKKYIVELEEGGKSITQTVWATTEIKGLDMNSFSNQGVKGRKPTFYREIDGVPLKMEMSMPEMDMTMEVTGIKKQSLSAGDFVVPPGFKEVKGMFGMN
ncbi:MAG TPA: DUF4412 domain-containing protein [Cyclobacteriaceae bacterium]|nr:DUF4412 domain-containing protein [Cyclobacteriaceae bacterium]